MLERVAGELLDSLESLATEQVSIGPQMSQGQLEFRALYFPVIVTNTELLVCEFGPDDVDLSEGMLRDKSGEFQSVPFVRFQKSFTSRYATTNVAMSLREANKENQRTILVIHAPQFPNFLRQWDMR